MTVRYDCSVRYECDVCFFVLSDFAGQSGLCNVGLSYVDPLSSCIGVAEFADDEDSLSNLESALVQLGCREVLSTPNKVLQQLTARADMALSERKAADFKSSSVAQDLQRLLDPRHHSMAQVSVALVGLLSRLSP